MSERDLEVQLHTFLEQRFPDLKVRRQVALPYGAGATIKQEFKIDILLQDPAPSPDEELIPRVAIELKARGIHTHDLLAYSAKANLHRTLCGYLRYGLFVAGDRAGGVTAKWLWHGHEFDFMLCSTHDRPGTKDLKQLEEIVAYEIEVSRNLQTLVNKKRGPYPRLLWRKATIV